MDTEGAVRELVSLLTAAAGALAQLVRLAEAAARQPVEDPTAVLLGGGVRVPEL